MVQVREGTVTEGGSGGQRGETQRATQEVKSAGEEAGGGEGTSGLGLG